MYSHPTCDANFKALWKVQDISEDVFCTLIRTVPTDFESTPHQLDDRGLGMIVMPWTYPVLFFSFLFPSQVATFRISGSLQIFRVTDKQLCRGLRVTATNQNHECCVFGYAKRIFGYREISASVITDSKDLDLKQTFQASKQMQFDTTKYRTGLWI